MYDSPVQPGLQASHPSSRVHVVVDEAQSQLCSQFSPQVPVSHAKGVTNILLLLQFRTFMGGLFCKQCIP